jgi:hypothetical protein
MQHGVELWKATARAWRIFLLLSSDFYFTNISSYLHHEFIERVHTALVMNQDIVKQIVRWSGRMVTLLGYGVIVGMVIGGLSLMGLAAILFVFSHGIGASVCMLCGAAFVGVGSLAMLRQLRSNGRDLRQRLAQWNQQETTAG